MARLTVSVVVSAYLTGQRPARGAAGRKVAGNLLQCRRIRPAARVGGSVVTRWGAAGTLLLRNGAGGDGAMKGGSCRA